MCRFNMILIKDGNAEELLEQDGYQKFDVNLPGYTAYQKGYCNCGSFVGSLIEKKGMRYDEAITERKREKLERLYQIRDFMNQPGYLERRENYNNVQNQFFEEYQAFSDPINEYELSRTKEIMEQYDGQDYRIQMENLHVEINNMLTELESQPEYRKKWEANMKFQQENELMHESLCYYLTKEDEEKAYSGSIPLSELLQREEEQLPQAADRIKYPYNSEMTEFPEAEEIIEIPIESFVIDEVIARTKKDVFEDNLCEYNSYYALFSKLLKAIPSFLFATIWSEPTELKKIKTVPIGSLMIDDLAFLDFDEMICIEN